MAQTIIKGENAYFAAMNCGKGFISLFDSIFFSKKIKRRYIIKGGPGTGKSSFLRKVALYAHNKKKSVEYYYCSSDTSSLDGIVIDGNIAIFDGTAPHCYDTKLAGICDEILNFGMFWDSDILKRNSEDIVRLSSVKSFAYDNAYGYLSAALNVYKTMNNIILPCVNMEKLKAAVNRICGGDVLSHIESPQICQMSAFGTQGNKRLDTLYNQSHVCYAVDDHYGVSNIFMRELMKYALNSGKDIKVSLCTADGETPNEILFSDSGEYFCICSEDERYCEGTKRINMKRFIDTESLAQIRHSYRAARQCYRTLTDLSSHELSKAGDAHAQIEKYYVGAMDFSALQKYCDAFIRKLNV